MDPNNPFYRQVSLLVQLLPILLSFKEGSPDWSHLGLPHIKQLPSVRWKLLNLERMKKNKRTEAIAKLEAVLHGGKSV